MSQLVTQGHYCGGFLSDSAEIGALGSVALAVRHLCGAADTLSE